MLKLPIRQRLADPLPAGPAAENAARVGRQILLESMQAWSPMPSPDEDGSGPTSSVTLTVKNTFIEFEMPQEEPLDRELHPGARGAQTCLARIAVPAPRFISMVDGKVEDTVDEEQNDNPPENLDPGPQDRNGGARRWADFTPGAGGSPVSFTGRLTQSCFAKITPQLASTPQAQQQQLLQPQQVPQRLSQAQPKIVSPQRVSPQAPPPCYAAPQAFQEQSLMPPPPCAPGSVGHHVLLAAMTGSLGSAMSPVRRASTPVNLPPGCPSAGSLQHGLIDDKGEPACQPCAWFYKTSGCNNGPACRRCHVCPEGELKTRKKQKIARLRNADGSSPANPDSDGDGS
mmetsp:Transcript_19474/g.51532  ORF Transcript_19474/g.51532 Transcript_19474/m.51532 type:complete len:343 (-) Transcript_19474:299-1327(-)